MRRLAAAVPSTLALVLLAGGCQPDTRNDERAEPDPAEAIDELTREAMEFLEGAAGDVEDAAADAREALEDAERHAEGAIDEHRAEDDD